MRFNSIELFNFSDQINILSLNVLFGLPFFSLSSAQGSIERASKGGNPENL